MANLQAELSLQISLYMPLKTNIFKNPFLLNFVFCFILLFSLNTSLKSVCNADIDMDGHSLINVGELIYLPIPLDPIVEFNGKNYVNWAGTEPDPEDISEFIQCTFDDKNTTWMLKTSDAVRSAAELTALCPTGFSYVAATTDYGRSVIPVIGTGGIRFTDPADYCYDDSSYTTFVTDATNPNIIRLVGSGYTTWGGLTKNGGWLTCEQD